MADFDQDDLDLGAEWEEEIRRRIDDVDSGRVQTIPGDEVFSRIEQHLRSRNAPPPALSEEQSEELTRRGERVRQHGPSGFTISEIREQLASGLPMSEEWEAEIQRRIDDVDSGRVQTVPGDEVFSRIAQRLRGR